jgi:hypothetical protein
VGLKKLGFILLAVWLILTGLFALVSVSFPARGTVMAILALAAGVLILLSLRNNSLSEPYNLGLLLLGIWLVLAGLLPLIGGLGGLGIVLDILAVVAGILLLYALGRRDPLADLGMLLLGLWLVLSALLSILGVGFPGSGVVLAVLALAAGILILIGR